MPLELRVIFGDTDQMGVVYYGNYLRYFEAARGHFIRARGGSYGAVQDAGFHLPVVEAHVNYRAPLKYDDVFVISATVAERKRASVRFDYLVTRAEQTIATGHTLHACVDRRGRVVAMPDEMIRFLDAPEGV
jgi:acyl-CoA thioester hydrolase